ncbi:MAG: hypothetical protein HY846_08245 [Nitrosomonadales bacterium]|nr:hypothetical protein [Nitrosomonadales bacterium]
MTQEAGQFDDLKRQLLITDTQPRKNTWTDIGEAQVTHTIFGRARVRIIRKKDNIRRALLLATLAVLVAMAAIWQGWTGIRQVEPQQSAVNEPASSGVAPLEAPAIQSAPAPLRDVAPPVQNKPAMPLPADIKAPATVQKSAPPQPPIKAPEPVAAKPAMVQPLPALKPQASAATAVEPPPGKSPAASSLATDAPAVTETDRSEPPSASSPAIDAAPLPEFSPPQSPADDQQQGEAVSEPGK